MKKFCVLIIFSLLTIFPSSLFAATKSAAKTSVMYVAVQNAAFKEKKSFFSSTVAELSYGQSVKVVNTSGKWVEALLTDSNKKGWIALSSLTKKKIKKSDFKASTDELALAGKGFSAEVEKNYRKTSSADYVAVDRIESLKVSDSELLKFIDGGNLNGGSK